MLRYRLVLFCCILMISCSDEKELDGEVQQQSNPLQIEQKYYLKDCIVKISFLWNGELNFREKDQIIGQVFTYLKFAVVSGDFPLFSGGSTREAAYIVIYFSDRCEDRVGMTRILIEDYLIPNVEGFPNFSIETDVMPGFSGSTPSGWWLDY